MKKIGIITIHNCKSFGACLQTYALYQYFLNIGYDCEVIDLRRKEQPNFVKSRKYRPLPTLLCKSCKKCKDRTVPTGRRLFNLKF